MSVKGQFIDDIIWLTDLRITVPRWISANSSSSSDAITTSGLWGWDIELKTNHEYSFHLKKLWNNYLAEFIGLVVIGKKNFPKIL